MKKTYYIKMGKFSNQYSLRWAEDGKEICELIANGYEKIPYKMAKCYAIIERQRRKDNPNFSGYADSSIFPCHYTLGYEVKDYVVPKEACYRDERL